MSFIESLTPPPNRPPENADIRAAIEALERAKATKLAEIEEINKAIAQVSLITPGTMPKSREYQGLGITKAATRFLTEVGEPRGTRDIADALRARGLQTRSKKFVSTVYATLDKSKYF